MRVAFTGDTVFVITGAIEIISAMEMIISAQSNCLNSNNYFDRGENERGSLRDKL